ncbi:hypothetical protein FOXG_14202 [Fusarium oxysporum f. sp. lycopersici 4287]|uniref:Uncharacterized protein n=1 Tax=Fusarium oxysporum f. sp. lycopersici (strain 4287 / CBS 123668 / FGSC 9935 / NRRL 34936) TaxID=426428 RepID=A0A0J9VZA1_FUSO4|nr:hypothetical protein FOXG_14202 [Fusarium oxysporum f. sp. lycopersici 4287]EWZ78067.1 hypothetical protein FOWG_17616 [Fusarium oxysporum f. sp. lycopersici MN25]KAJ9413569.1 hypothetical protein QL093DRAFT_2484722 [Fusarium oxysporum]KNB15835.1 hypothetical protein FOXG_14202 [Fusarium oxysporum f. sp. lycopersici 4287]
MESDGSLCREVSNRHDGSLSLEVRDRRIDDQSFKVSGSVQFMPLKPGVTGIFENATTVNGGCSTYGEFLEGNTIHPGVTQTNNPEFEPSFFWTDGIKVASRFIVPRGTSGVLCSGPGKYDFQVWTLQFEPVGIIKVTTSESREQAELAYHAVLKIRNTEQRKKLIQALQSQTGTHLQKTNLEVMYNHGMFLITNGSHHNTVEVESLSEKKGVYVWIHDGKLIADGTILTKEFREIFGIEQKKEQMMKMAQGAAMAAWKMQMLQQWCSRLYGGNR